MSKRKEKEKVKKCDLLSGEEKQSVVTDSERF